MELGITYFDQATLTVKIVMIILVIASIWSWTVILEKLIYFPFERRRIDQTVKKIFSTHEWDKRNDELNYKIQMKKELKAREKKMLQKIEKVFIKLRLQFQQRVNSLAAFDIRSAMPVGIIFFHRLAF